MHHFATPYRHNHGAYATAIGAFILDPDRADPGKGGG
jgi:hypothetical protein